MISVSLLLFSIPDAKMQCDQGQSRFLIAYERI